ncbi:MAG TPA: exodeoxyribonuclease VII large subunit, partial [Leptolinea sp.]
MFQLPLIRPSAFTVSEVTAYLRTLLDSDSLLQDVWIAGEVSNLSRPASGHIYFTLKDAGAAIKCVIWRSAALRMPEDLQVGSQIEAHGAVSLYERDGACQLYVNAIRMRGEGELYQEFLRLKSRLEAEGYFDEDRKRPLPELPQKIGIVTSATGAALQDMLNTLRGRYRLAEIIIAPAAVQGLDAPGEIIDALKRLNRQIHPDVILLARGGGSMEDLWAFNDEQVVRAIVDSEAPVVTGIGHETDFTLADFAADLRAPTPTGAAVMATPAREDLLSNIEDTIQKLSRFVAASLETSAFELDQAKARLTRESPLRRVERERQQTDAAAMRMEVGINHRLVFWKEQTKNSIGRLRALSPQAVLSRGYALVRLDD